MRFALFLFIFFLFVIEFAFYRVLKTAFPSNNFLFYAELLFNIAFIGLVSFLIYIISKAKRSGEKWKQILRLSSFFFVVIIPKIFIISLSLIENITFYFTKYLFKIEPYSPEIAAKILLIFAVIPLIAFVHGYFFGRYNFKVIKKTINFKNLPVAFDGFKLLQISDIHSGSLSNVKEIKKGIDLINKQQADLIVFTGDLINHHIEEIEDWMEVFSNIKSAKFGNYSVLGNHDYGNKFNDIPPNELNDIVKTHTQIQQKMGFKLLVNETQPILKSNQKINLIGVENYGAFPFPQFGNLTKATQNVDEEDFNILLSHDPSHFDLEVKSFIKNINLTLSGHTHGMQFGIEFLGLKWSPVKYKYPKWAGLYKENNKFLYVNRGFGYIGVPIRIGIWPEITVITLKKAK